MRIRRYKPPISVSTQPFRTVRRLQQNPTYTPLMTGPVVNALVLAALSATSAMSGLTLGFCIRLAGL
jgi:multisubunit Na+/H+ antiporter MnhC subunit